MGFEIKWKRDLEDGCDVFIESPIVKSKVPVGHIHFEWLDDEQVLINEIEIKAPDLDTDDSRKEIIMGLIDDLKLSGVSKLFIEIEDSAFMRPHKWYKDTGFKIDDSIKEFKFGIVYGDQYISKNLGED